MGEKPSTVAVVKGRRSHKPVFKALDLIDFKTALAGWDKGVIKVNFICDKTWDTGATTDPLVVEAIIKRVAELPVSGFVVGFEAPMTKADKTV